MIDNWELGKLKEIETITTKDGNYFNEKETKVIVNVIEAKLYMLELIRKKLKINIFGRIVYVDDIKEKNGIFEDRESSVIMAWLKDSHVVYDLWRDGKVEEWLNEKEEK